MSNDAPIETSRLRLILLSPEALELLRQGDVEGASTVQGFEFSDDFLLTVNESFLTNHLEGVRRRPSTPGWFVRAILRRDDDHLIGHCGFHGTPDDVGRAEVGYTIFPPYRARGYAVESVQGLVDWARTQGSRVVFAAVAPNNLSSLRLLRKLGFQHTGVQLNGVDDEEYVFELRV